MVILAHLNSLQVLPLNVARISFDAHWFQQIFS